MSDTIGPTLFLCWSDRRSKQVAEALKQYFESVLEAVCMKPGTDLFIEMSETLIAKGAPWSEQLMRGLHNAQAGIIVLTPENRRSAWLHFEGGAIATHGLKTGTKTTTSQNNLFGFLFTIDTTQIDGPLSLFQTTTYRRVYERDRAELKLLTSAVLDCFNDHRLDNLKKGLQGKPVDKRLKEALDSNLDILLGRLRELHFFGFRELVPGLEGHARQLFQSIYDLVGDGDKDALSSPLPRRVQALSAMLSLRKLLEDLDRDVEVTCDRSQQMFFKRLLEVLSASSLSLERTIGEPSQKVPLSLNEPLLKLRRMLEVAVEPLVPVLDDAWQYAVYALHGQRTEAYSKQKLLLIHPLESTLQRARLETKKGPERVAAWSNSHSTLLDPRVPAGHLLSPKEKGRALRSFWAYDRVAAYIHYCEDMERPTRKELLETLSELTQAVLKEISLIELSMTGARQEKHPLDGKKKARERPVGGKQEVDDLPLRFALRALILKIKIGIGHGSDVLGERKPILDELEIRDAVESRIKGEAGLSFRGIRELITSIRTLDERIGLLSSVGLKAPIESLCCDLERLVSTRSKSRRAPLMLAIAGATIFAGLIAMPVTFSRLENATERK